MIFIDELIISDELLATLTSKINRKTRAGSYPVLCSCQALRKNHPKSSPVSCGSLSQMGKQLHILCVVLYLTEEELIYHTNYQREVIYKKANMIDLVIKH